MASQGSVERRSAMGKVVDRLAALLSGLPRATTDYTIARGVRVPVRDGVELAADLYQPLADAVGTLLVRGPYGRSLPLALSFGRIFAGQGYNALFVSSRGTFGSGGTFDPMRTESDDGQDVVAWMVRQPWFTGSFATLGPSYLAYTQWALMADPPAELAAAVVSIGPHDFWKHVWGTGAFRLDFLGWSDGIVHQEEGGVVAGTLRMASGARRVRPFLDQLPLAGASETLLEDRAPWYVDWVTRPDGSDPFWAPMRHGDALERAAIPVLLIGGWQDLFVEQTVAQYERLHERGVDVAMTIDPWSHLGTARSLRIVNKETFDWLEEHVAKRGGRRRTSPVRVFVRGAGAWRDLPSWPPPTDARVLYLHADRHLSSEPPAVELPPSTFTFDPAHPTPTVGGPLLAGKCDVEDSALGARPDVLSFTADVLRADLDVLGAPVVNLQHGSDNPHADLFARVSEVDRRGRSHNVAEGYVRLDPGRGDGPLTLALRPTAHRFLAGSRVRLLVAGGSHPLYARNLGTGDNPGTGVKMRPARHRVAHPSQGCSHLVLPVAADAGDAAGAGDAGPDPVARSSVLRGEARA